MIKRGWLIFFIVVLLVVIFFNLRYLGLATFVQTTSNFTIIPENYPPVLEDLDDNLYVCEGESLSYYFLANDSDGNPLNAWIDPQNPFFVFWVSQTAPNTHQFIIVSGEMDKNPPDLGGVNSGWKVHEETVYVDDDFNNSCCNDSEEINITVIEINNLPVIENVGVQTVWTQGENSTFYETVDANDTEYGMGYGSLTYNVTIINLATGLEEDLFDINSFGLIDFTADNDTPVGVYNVTVCVLDTGLSIPHENISDYCDNTGNAYSTCDSFTLTVTDENRAPNITNYYPENLTFSAPGTAGLIFNVTEEDADGTIPDAYWYLDGVLVETDSGSSVDNFTHTFGCDSSGTHTVKVDVTDGELNDSIQWNFTTTLVACFSPGGGGGSGGGGGVGFRNFDVNPLFVSSTLLHKEGESFDINITNNGDELLNMVLTLENMSEKALVNVNNFSLSPGQSKIVNLYLYALTQTKPGVYFGKLKISDGFIEKDVNIVLEVKGKEALFDFKVTILPEYKGVYPGQNIKVLVDLLNVGLYGTAVDVELKLFIMDFDKLILYETQKEFIAVEKNLTLERELFVPGNTKSGSYLVLGKMKYSNLTIDTHDTFNVYEKSKIRTTYVFLILLLIGLIIFIFFLIWKRRKDRRERGYR